MRLETQRQSKKALCLSLLTALSLSLQGCSEFSAFVEDLVPVLETIATVASTAAEVGRSFQSASSTFEGSKGSSPDPSQDFGSPSSSASTWEDLAELVQSIPAVSEGVPNQDLGKDSSGESAERGTWSQYDDLSPEWLEKELGGSQGQADPEIEARFATLKGQLEEKILAARQKQLEVERAEVQNYQRSREHFQAEANRIDQELLNSDLSEAEIRAKQAEAAQWRELDRLMQALLDELSQDPSSELELALHEAEIETLRKDFEKLSWQIDNRMKRAEEGIFHATEAEVANYQQSLAHFRSEEERTGREMRKLEREISRREDRCDRGCSTEDRRKIAKLSREFEIQRLRNSGWGVLTRDMEALLSALAAQRPS